MLNIQFLIYKKIEYELNLILNFYLINIKMISEKSNKSN